MPGPSRRPRSSPSAPSRAQRHADRAARGRDAARVVDQVADDLLERSTSPSTVGRLALDRRRSRRAPPSAARAPRRARRTTGARSMRRSGSSPVAPSMRCRMIRSFASRARRSDSPTIVDEEPLRVLGVDVVRPCSVSAAPRMAVSGVRSSWLTSETKRDLRRSSSRSSVDRRSRPRRPAVERRRRPRASRASPPASTRTRVVAAREARRACGQLGQRTDEPAREQLGEHERRERRTATITQREPRAGSRASSVRIENVEADDVRRADDCGRRRRVDGRPRRRARRARPRSMRVAAPYSPASARATSGRCAVARADRGARRRRVGDDHARSRRARASGDGVSAPTVGERRGDERARRLRRRSIAAGSS